jgi:Rad3-related DNA helicase
MAPEPTTKFLWCAEESKGSALRAKEAGALAAKGLPIYGNLCDSAKGRCPHFHGCPHLAQSREAAGAPVGIVTHAHLATDKWDSTNDFYWNLANSDTLVIDEAQLSSLIEVKELSPIRP